jgi:hypothetical protein
MQAFCFCCSTASLLSRKVYRILKAEGNSWTWPLSILTFLLVFGIIIYLVIVVLDHNASLGR